MARLTRRHFLCGTGRFAAATALGGMGLLDWAHAWAADLPFKPEAGAKLRLLRWNRFVVSEGVQFDNNIAAFTQATGVEVQVDKEFVDDIQPKAAVAANVGAGPDLIWGTMAIPQLVPDKLLDVTDVAHYLGDKYGGWHETPMKYCVRNGKWTGLPLCVGGVYINYRTSWLKQAGFAQFPTTTDEFLKLSRELQKIGHPGGFALGRALGDGNAWAHWVVWAFGGKMVDEAGNVVINSPETKTALEYARELAQTWTGGTASWNDASNNKAFLAGEVGYTNNGISIYAKAVADGKAEPDDKTKNDPNALQAFEVNRHKMAEIAADMDHAYYPIGPVGKPTELQLPNPIEAFAYSRYPNACKTLLAFLMEKAQYDAWLQQSAGYFTQTLKGYDDHPLWSEDPKRRVYKDASTRSLDIGHAGPLGYAAAGVYADFVMLDMVAQAATGQATAAEAMATAEKRALRYYRV